MKVAIAVDGTEVSQHFGHCDGYVIYTVDDGRVKEQIMVMNPGHVPGVLPKMLIDRGVGLMIAGGLGTNAQKIFRDAGIDLIVGSKGEAAEVIQHYLEGNLNKGENSCDH